jgi:hypothetical protein
MGLSLDHVVIAVRDLDRTIADYTALGFTVTVGGEHTGGASHNALIVFADGAYIELIAFKRPNPEFRWWRVLDEAGDGFVDYALLPGTSPPMSRRRRRAASTSKGRTMAAGCGRTGCGWTGGRRGPRPRTCRSCAATSRRVLSACRRARSATMPTA